MNNEDQDVQDVKFLNEALKKHGAIREFVADSGPPFKADSYIGIVFEDGSKAELTACNCCDGVNVSFEAAP